MPKDEVSTRQVVSVYGGVSAGAEGVPEAVTEEVNAEDGEGDAELG